MSPLPVVRHLLVNARLHFGYGPKKILFFNFCTVAFSPHFHFRLRVSYAFLSSFLFSFSFSLRCFLLLCFSPSAGKSKRHKYTMHFLFFARFALPLHAGCAQHPVRYHCTLNHYPSSLPPSTQTCLPNFRLLLLCEFVAEVWAAFAITFELLHKLLLSTIM